jgi:hypothetical protein
MGEARSKLEFRASHGIANPTEIEIKRNRIAAPYYLPRYTMRMQDRCQLAMYTRSLRGLIYAQNKHPSRAPAARTV